MIFRGDDHSIRAGDVVVLVSGGPRMVVERANGFSRSSSSNNRHVTVSWFGKGGTPYRGDFYLWEVRKVIFR